MSGLSGAATLARIELPIAWPGVLAAFVLTFAHTLGEFGVVLMVGGNIPSRTRTLSIAIYDRVQAFDMEAAGLLSALLLAASLVAMALVRALAGRPSGSEGADGLAMRLRAAISARRRRERRQGGRGSPPPVRGRSVRHAPPRLPRSPCHDEDRTAGRRAAGVILATAAKGPRIRP